LGAQWLSDRLGQPFIIENRPGGGGNIAIDAAVKAPADGYTKRPSAFEFGIIGLGSVTVMPASRMPESLRC